ncbi:MAG: alkaline phosphatase, partial [Planctomycetes bacterium]|nr:alkaline phosphatase [Planctomycetota bacterium]
MKDRPKRFLHLLCVTTLLMTGSGCSDLLPSSSSTTRELAEHVVIIGVDGMSPDGIAHAKTIHMDKLMREGAYTMHARGVMPTVSSPNWASMMMGAGPEQHGITSNSWRPDQFAIPPTRVGSDGVRFETIFGLLRQQRPDAVIACFYDWSGIGVLFGQKDFDVTKETEGFEETTRLAVEVIKKRQCDLTFIYYGRVDTVGHEKGHGTAEYYQAVEEADRYIGQVLKGLEEAGIRDNTIVLITSDHGGVGKGHGGATLAEIEIPWIINGRGIAKGEKITAPVNTYDTAATIAYIFGLT